MESSFVIYLIKNKKADRTVKTEQRKAEQQKQNSKRDHDTQITGGETWDVKNILQPLQQPV